MSKMRNEPTYDWPSVYPEIAKAKNRVLLLQTWFPTLPNELPAWKEALLKGSVDFKVLLADQKLVEHRLRSREPVDSLLMQNVSQIRYMIEDLQGQTTSKPQVRFYKMLPFGPIYVIDEEVFWGIYLSHMDSTKGPVFRARADSQIAQDVIASFNTAWEEASERTGGLSVTENLVRKGKKHAEEEIEIKTTAAIISGKVIAVSSPEEKNLKGQGGYLCMLRHAETDLNDADIITGGLDIGINAAGRDHVRQLRPTFAHVAWDAIYSSPARRCTETLTEMVADAGAILLRDELRERSMGELEGYAKATYQASVPRYQNQDVLHSFHASADDGEAYCDVFYRLADFLQGIVEEVHRGRRILICTHDSIIQVIFLLLENLDLQKATERGVISGRPIYYASRN